MSKVVLREGMEQHNHYNQSMWLLKEWCTALLISLHFPVFLSEVS